MFSASVRSYRAVAPLALIVAAFMPSIASAGALDGRWLGYLGCTDQGFQSTFFLEIVGTTARLSGSAIRPQIQAVALGADDSFSTAFSGWDPDYRRGPNSEIGLQGTRLADPEALHGTVEGWRTQCPSFVAMRAPQPRSGEDRSGILFKAVGNGRSDPALPACRDYARWLASGDEVRLGRRPTQITTNLLDADAMRRVLGKDIYSWSDDDRGRINTVGMTCRQLLSKSSDPADARLVKAAGRVWVPQLLKTLPDTNLAGWHTARILAQSELLLSLPELRARIEEGLYDKPGPDHGAAAKVAAAEGDFAGQWHGYFDCGGRERYLQLTIERRDGGYDATAAFGPSLTDSFRRGTLAMSADAPADGRLSFSPQSWIDRAPGVPPFDLSVRKTSDDRIEGSVESGGESCALHARRVVEPVRGKNADGLLFKITGARNGELDLDDCRRYARWLAGDKTIKVGPRDVSTLILDQDAMFAVLGKDAASWGDDDHLKIRDMAMQCERAMRDSFDRSDRRLVEQVRDWSPNPFPLPKKDDRGWWEAAQVPLVLAEASEAVDAQYAQLAALPASLDSLTAADRLLDDLAKGKGRLLFLPDDKKKAQLSRLEEERERLGVRVADTIAAKYDTYPQTLDGLDGLAAFHAKQTIVLEKLKAVRGADRLEDAYAEAARTRALALWPDALDMAERVIGALKDASFAHFPEISALDAKMQRLERYYVPKGDALIARSYTHYKEERRATIDAMVARSQAALAEWIDVLPPSKAATEKLEALSQAAFDQSSFPEQFAALRSAAKAKRAAYNPDGWRRPDIGLALLRGHWAEVDHEGLESLAYVTTMLRSLKEQCPGIVPDGDGDPGAAPLMSYSAAASADAVDRMRRGEFASEQEAQRAVFMFLNTVVNRPGCRVGYFGRVVGCVSQQEFADSQQALMTSGAALEDANTLPSNGCSADAPRRFVDNIVKYARLDPHSRAVPPMVLIEAWDYVAENE